MTVRKTVVVLGLTALLIVGVSCSEPKNGTHPKSPGGSPILTGALVGARG